VRAIRRGYTLVEMLMATALTLIMMAAVASVFGTMGTSISGARATLEMSDALRGAAAKLRSDLEGITATMNPPRRPEDGEGYFEYTEGPIGPVVLPSAVASNNDLGTADSTEGDIDDMIMGTSRSHSDPFVGKSAAGVIESQDAEIAWFVRGRTLYRRVLLIRPDIDVTSRAPAGFYANNDISVRNVGGTLYSNSLSDLTKPENRFAHQNALGAFSPFAPFHPHRLTGWATNSGAAPPQPGLGLPILQECSDANWVAGGAISAYTFASTFSPAFDAWLNPHPWQLAGGAVAVDTSTGALTAFPNGTRVGEDVVLNNVIGFDVKVWDPNAPVVLDSTGAVLMPGDSGYNVGGSYTTISYGAYVDLGYGVGIGQPTLSLFSGNGNATTGLNRVYDTWSLHYEYGGTGTDGFDNDGNGVVDDVGEMVAPPPYAVPLRGIQIKIRVFEPDSKQIREVTIVQDFVGK
jgi:prepilin-type N-terminal cleavage/methylation domain-containing protein